MDYGKDALSIVPAAIANSILAPSGPANNSILPLSRLNDGLTIRVLCTTITIRSKAGQRLVFLE
jgi:hypothetical protein